MPPANIGVDEFEFWTPHRRPEGQNIAMKIYPAIQSFKSDNIGNGYVRPWGEVNAWVADLNDEKPTLKVEWDETKAISEIKLFLDPDYDHPMESTLMGHPEEVVPFCVRNYTIKDLDGNVLHVEKGNYQTINTFKPNESLNLKGFTIEFVHPSKDVPAAIFEILCQ